MPLGQTHGTDDATEPLSMRGQNVAIAKKLRNYAALLEQQGADGFRERAYRRAADTIANLERPVAYILATDGPKGLIALRGVGKGIACAITEMVTTGHWSQLERLRGNLDPTKLFQSIPGIGPILAQRLADQHHLETLEDLEAALVTSDVAIKGLGLRRRESIAAILAERLGRPVARIQEGSANPPPIDLLIEVDTMYRQRAKTGSLKMIAPKRLNPKGDAWLPIMHARHDDWHFTIMFSNTRLAHELDRTSDWVVIYHQENGHVEGRSTVVTETSGPLIGKRTVRGRETECAHFYSV